jgi:hypothetical protein
MSQPGRQSLHVSRPRRRLIDPTSLTLKQTQDEASTPHNDGSQSSISEKRRDSAPLLSKEGIKQRKILVAAVITYVHYRRALLTIEFLYLVP